MYDDLKVFRRLDFAHKKRRDGTKFMHEAEDVSLLETLLESRVGICLILTLKRCLYHGMWYLWRICFPRGLRCVGLGVDST